MPGLFYLAALQQSGERTQMAEIPAQNPAAIREYNITLEAVILLVLGIFMGFFGLLLFPIHTGALPYSPDSTYGLFLVIVALQVITMGKTPFGTVRRSWIVILSGITAGIIGMSACFIPGALSDLVRILVGALLVCGGAVLFLQLILNPDKAAVWFRAPGILRHLTIACGLSYVMAFLLGLVTLVPALTNDKLTAALLIIDSVTLFYLAWCIQTVERMYPGKGMTGPLVGDDGELPVLLRDAPLSFTAVILIFLGVLISLLAVLLVPVALGILQLSADGQLGLLLILMAVQVLAIGNTPVGQFRRSWPVVAIGLVFVILGIFSCIVPGVTTFLTRMMIAVLNIAGGIILLALRLYPIVHQARNPSVEPVIIPAVMKHLLILQSVLNIVGILFGTSVLLPGLIPGLVLLVILFCYGLLLFAVAVLLERLPAAA